MGWLEAIPIVGQAVQAGLDYSISKQNLTFQQQNLDYQKAMQREAWMREDTASQRKMADLKAAGLNPLLAYGQQAQSSGPIRTEAPQMEQIQPAAKIAQGASMALNLMQQKANIERTFAETEAIRLQQAEKAIDIEYKKQMNPYQIEFADNKAMFDFQNKIAENLILQSQSDQESYKRLLANANAQIANLGITKAEWEIKMLPIREKALEMGIKLQDVEVLAKQLAIKEREFNLAQYEKLGLPTNQAWGNSPMMNIIKAAQLGSTIGKRLLESARIDLDNGIVGR